MEEKKGEEPLTNIRFNDHFFFSNSMSVYSVCSNGTENTTSYFYCSKAVFQYSGLYCHVEFRFHFTFVFIP